MSSVRLPDSVPVLGLAHIRVPDADHIGTGLAEHARVFSTCNFGTRVFGATRIHADEHSLARMAPPELRAALSTPRQVIDAALSAMTRLVDDTPTAHAFPVPQ